MSNDSFDGASSLVGDCGIGLQLFKTSFCSCSIFFRFELPRRILRLDFRDGAGDAAVTIMSICVSCCSSSPDCSMHVGRIFEEPDGESLTEFVSLFMLCIEGQLLRSALPMTEERSRKILSSRAFNEPKTHGGVKWIRGGSCEKRKKLLRVIRAD